KGLLNMHIRWSSEDDRFEVSLWAKNLTNTQSIINNADLSNFFDTIPEYNAGKIVSIDNWTDSRTLGISLTGKF
ncbi:MAG TPA: hypothetical protein VKQ54_15255, partial [Caulobacteraceae bacterium]|nr:hypothetical protein [Caulobacteraceae bacterium]